MPTIFLMKINNGISLLSAYFWILNFSANSRFNEIFHILDLQSLHIGLMSLVQQKQTMMNAARPGNSRTITSMTSNEVKCVHHLPRATGTATLEM